VNICILAWGGNGDVLPMLALAKGLRRTGHAAAFAAPARFRRAAEGLGCRFFPVGPDPDHMLEEADVQSSLRSSSGIAALRSIGRLARIMVDGWMRGCLPAAEGADLVVAGFVPGFFVGTAVSEQAGAPFLPAFLIPLTPTRSEPTFALFLVRTLGPILNRLTHAGTLHLIWNVLLPAVNRFRREELGFESAGRGGWFLDHIRRGRPVLYGYSRCVVPVPEDWDSCNRVTGYWFPDPPPDFRPPRELERFLDSGPPPVVIGFGSMAAGDSGEWMEISRDALRMCARRGILLTGTAPVPDFPPGADVFTADFLPHAWLYGRAAAAVHHGGAGATGAALRAGIPAVTVPHNFDQPFWGNRVARLGAGPPPILRRRLTAERLAAAIDRALTDADMRRRAAALGRQIRAEDGVAAAIGVIEEVS
jgi:sterol 3beta-glucosyltransferase